MGRWHDGQDYCCNDAQDAGAAANQPFAPPEDFSQFNQVDFIIDLRRRHGIFPPHTYEPV